MMSVRSISLISFLLYALGCANSGNVAGSNGRKNSKPESNTSDSDESLGNNANENTSTTENVTTEESSAKTQYDDSEPSSPQDISGAFLVCAQLESPTKDTAPDQTYFGCSMTLDDKTLYDFSPFDTAWSVRDAAGFDVKVEHIDGPKNSVIQKVFKATTTVFNGVKTIVARLSNKKNSADFIDVKGEIEKGKIYPFPTENDLDAKKTCPVCPQ